MMAVRKRFTWLPVAALAAALASILAFLYVRTQSHDTSNYFENVALLRQLKQVDARWELDVLKSKMGVNSNYDSLADPLVDLNLLLEQLQVVVSGRQPGIAHALAAGNDALRHAVEDKTRLIENFKSHNSVLRNSLAFLPTSAADIHAAMAGAGARFDRERAEASARANHLLLDGMVFSHAASNGRAADIRADLAKLVASRNGLPPAAREVLDVFALHVATVLREQPVVNKLLGDIAQVPTAARIDALDNLLGADQKQAAEQAQQYRQYLLGFAAALAGLVLYAAGRLIRSHAVINRVNQQLLGANATLEQRVLERTLELRAAQGELVTAARQAGMAEVANNVLHNVGNVLNSVNVSAGVVTGRIRDSRTRGLAKAVRLMNEHAANLGDFLTLDAKGKLLPGYLNRLVAAIAAEQQGIVDEMGCLTTSVDHIKDIVAGQQAHAGSASVVAPVRVGDLMEDALRINAAAMAEPVLTVVREFDDVPELMLDRHRLLQILVNLIGNARQAMAGMHDRSARLSLALNLTESVAGRRLLIRVADEGEGIPAENLPRIFTHGFTTRRDGHGFGLHSCVLAAREMGGTLSAHSAGAGLGAIFTLDLPTHLSQGTS